MTRTTRRTTIYDIAVAARASPTTVSLVLNDSWQKYRISGETASRVLACAEELGYSVNLKARGLRSIAVRTCRDDHAPLPQPVFCRSR